MLRLVWLARLVGVAQLERLPWLGRWTLVVMLAAGKGKQGCNVCRRLAPYYLPYNILQISIGTIMKYYYYQIIHLLDMNTIGQYGFGTLSMDIEC